MCPTAVKAKQSPRRKKPLPKPAARKVEGVVFPSKLGWFALLADEHEVQRLSFFHASPRAAAAHLDGVIPSEPGQRWVAQLVKRLQAYAAGKRDDFLDVPVATAGLSDFTRAVMERCRRIAPGDVMTYGELADAVKAPRAARAVGTVMARNTVGIIIPCHRVVAAGGRLGGYSMGAGLTVKARLLNLEKGGKTRGK